MATSISFPIIAPSSAGSTLKQCRTMSASNGYNRTSWRCATSRTNNCSQRGTQQYCNGVKSKTERIESNSHGQLTQLPFGNVKSTSRINISSQGTYPKSGPSPAKTSRKRLTKQGRADKSSSAAMPRGRPASPHPVKLKLSISNDTEDAEMIQLSQNLSSEKRRFSSVVDSGHGDELSCSCDSDSQLESNHNKRDSLIKSCGSHVSHSNSCSDIEDDIFQDALSNLPSCDDCISSTSSSAFVTPLSTRSQSPLFPPTNPDVSYITKEKFAHCLNESLQKVEVNRLTSLSNVIGEISAPLNGHMDVTITTAKSGAGDGSDDSSIPVSQVRTGLNTNTTGTNSKSKQKKRLNGLQRPQVKRIDQSSSPIHDASLPTSNKDAEQREKSKLTSSRNRKSRKTVNEADDSGCSVGYGSTSSASSSKAKKSRHSIPSLNHKQQMNFESISISSASPSSSVCSHSPTTLSPSPTSSFGNQLTVENSINPSLHKLFSNDTINLDSKAQDGEAKDEWPDLGMEFRTPPKPPADKIHTHLEIEAQFSESPPDSKTEDNDSGCNMSISSSIELSFGSTKHQSHQQQKQQEQQNSQQRLEPYPLVGNMPTHFPFNDPLFQNQRHPYLVSPEHYLWLQSQQLNMFIQQHQEQQEKQTDKQLFYPVNPSPPPQPISIHEPMNIHCPHPVHPPLPINMHPPPPPPHLIPQQQHQQHFPPTPLHPRPLFFSLLRLHDSQFVPPSGPRLQTGISDHFYPPPPPPPPPLPIQPYRQNASLTINTNASLDSWNEDSSLDDDNDGVHPLQDTWVMWYDRITGNHRNQSSDYQASLKKLLSVNTVERFWQLHNNILQPHEMEVNSNFHFFKNGIQPLWEDPANREGGKWVFTIKNDCNNLAQSWLEVLLLLIGSSLERWHQVNGAVVSRRKKGDRIALWTNTRKEKANVDICTELIRSLLIAYNTPSENIRQFVKQLSEGKNGLSLVFMHHRDSLKSGHSYQNDAHITLSDHIDVILKKLQKVL